MKTACISQMSWTDFAEISKTVHTVILPAGAMECYGPHLPLASDTIVAEAVARRLAERTEALIGPTIPVGDSASLSMFPGTLCVRPESFRNYMQDLLDSLLKWGMTNFLFINGHAGNTPLLSQLAMQYRLRDDTLRFAQIDWWRYVQAECPGVLDHTGYMGTGHAGECGTSVLMYLAPELVHRDRLRCVEPKVVNGKRFPGVLRTTPFNEFSEAGMIGDASAATAEKGRLIVERSIDRILAYMEQDFTDQR